MLGRDGTVTLKLRRFARVGLWSLIVLSSAATAWGQAPGDTTRTQPAGGTTATGALPGGQPSNNPPAGSQGLLGQEKTETRQGSPAMRAKDFIVPSDGLDALRKEVELVEAEIASSRARVRVAEAQLKQAKDALNIAQRQGNRSVADDERLTLAGDDVAIKAAELEVERADLREHELLLKWGRQHLHEMEQPSGTGGNLLGMGHMDAGMMPMGHNGMGGSPEVMAIMEVNRKLEMLRGAVMRLEDEMETLLDHPSAKGNPGASASSNERRAQ